MKLTDEQNKRFIELGVLNFDVPPANHSLWHAQYPNGAILNIFLYLHGYVLSPGALKQSLKLQPSKEVGLVNYYGDILGPPIYDLKRTAGEMELPELDFSKESFPTSVHILREIFDELKYIIASEWTGKLYDSLNIKEFTPHEQPLKTLASLDDEDILSDLYYNKQFSLKDVSILEVLLDDKTVKDVYFSFTNGVDKEMDFNFRMVCFALIYKGIPIEDTQIPYEDYIDFLDVFLEKKVKLPRQYRKVLAKNVLWCMQELTDRNVRYEHLLEILNKAYYVYHCSDYINEQQQILFQTTDS